jgi:hypothetical protein
MAIYKQFLLEQSIHRTKSIFMKTTKIIFAALLFVFFCAVNVQAQKKGKQGQDQTTPLTPEQKAQRTQKHLQKRLGLSQDQALNVYNITLAHINKLQALKAQKANGQKIDGAAKQEKTNYDAAINQLLTADQLQKWIQLKAEVKAKHDAKKQSEGTPNTDTSTEDPEDYTGDSK